MTLALGLLLTFFLAYKLRNRSTHLCVLMLTSPIVVISFPVILFVSKVRGRLQTMLTRGSERAGSGKLLTFWLTFIM